jgi:hypothetical protein
MPVSPRQKRFAKRYERKAGSLGATAADGGRFLFRGEFAVLEAAGRSPAGSGSSSETS